MKLSAARLLPLSFALVLALGGGCIHSGAADRTPRPDPDAAGPAGSAAGQTPARDEPYFGRTVPDDDTPPGNIFIEAMSDTGQTVSRSFSRMTDWTVKTFKWFNGDRPSTQARKMEDSNSADDRRAGINGLLEYDFAKRQPYTRRYRQIAQADNDPTVRAVAIRALNRARDRSATGVFVSSLSDKSALARLEAAKALVHLPDSSAVPRLLAILDDREENRDVRMAAADALKHYRTLPVARALVASLAERDFGVSWQSRQSLRYLTGRNYEYDEGAWLAYFTGPDKPLG